MSVEDCRRCGQTFHVRQPDYDPPESSLCWTCATVVVDMLVAEPEDLPICELDLRAWPPASTPGGQRVTRSDSGVLAIHVPTGVASMCDHHRSQHSNKREALRRLAVLVRALRLREDCRPGGDQG